MKPSAPNHYRIPAGEVPTGTCAPCGGPLTWPAQECAHCGRPAPSAPAAPANPNRT